METVLKAPDIMCNGCANTIVNALTAVEGVDQVNVDVEQKTVNLAMSSNVLFDVKAKLTEIGYPAEE